MRHPLKMSAAANTIATGAAATTAGTGGVSLAGMAYNSAVNAVGEAGKSQEQKEAEAGGKTGSGTCGGNWLVQLAGAMAKIQEKFLSAAMANKDTMVANSEGMTQGPAAPAANNGGVTVGPNGTAQTATNNGAAPGTQTSTADNKTADAQKKEREDFIDAQAKFQANMQMFNNIATMTSTTIKTLGEALTMSIKPKVLLSCLPLMFTLSCGGGGGGGDDPGPGPNPGDTLNPGLVGRFYAGVWVMDADTGEYTLTPNTNWSRQTDRFHEAAVKSFFPGPVRQNGSAFMVTAYSNSDSSVALQDYNGNYLAQLNMSGPIDGAAVSQDLQHVLLVRHQDLHEWMELYDWNRTLIDNKELSGRHMTWLRDNRLLYSNGRTFYTTKPLSLETDEAFTMTLPEPGVGNVQAGVIGDQSVSPDETQIAFVIVDEDSNGAWINAQLYMVNRDGTGLRRVATVYGEDPKEVKINGVEWSPDGRWLYVINGYINPHSTESGLTYYPDMYLIPAEDMGKVFTLSTNVAERSPEVRLFYRYLTLPNEHGGKTNKANLTLSWIPDR